MSQDTLCQCKCSNGNRVCVCVTVTLIFATPKRATWTPTTNTAPGCLFVLWSCLRICSYCSLGFWFVSHGNNATHLTEQLHLDMHRFYPSNFPKGLGMHTYICMVLITHIHIFASHDTKTTWESKYPQMPTETQVHACKAPSTDFFCSWCGPLTRATQWHTDIEEKRCTYRMKEQRRREKRKGCTFIQLAALARSNYFYSP